MIKNLFITLAFALMLINPSISIAAESPVDVQEVFVGSETMDGDALKYPKGKAEIRLQRVELAEGGIVPLHSHPIPLLGNVEQGTIVVKRQGMEDLIYTAGDTFIVGPKTPKHTMGNAKTDNAIKFDLFQIFLTSSFLVKNSIKCSIIIVINKHTDINNPKILVCDNNNKTNEILIIFFCLFSNNLQKIKINKVLRP